MHKALHPRDDVGRLYVSRKEGGRGFDNTMDKRMTIARKQKWEEKQLYERFKRLIYKISHEKT